MATGILTINFFLFLFFSSSSYIIVDELSSRGLTLPQFLDMMARLAMLMAYRDQKELKDPRDCYEELGIFEHGGGCVMGDEVNSDNEEIGIEENNTEDDLDELDHVNMRRRSSVNRDNQWHRSLNIGRAIVKYIVKPFENFTSHG